MPNYIAGNGITIENNIISSKTTSTSEIGSFKVDGSTIYIDNNNVIHGKKEQKITLSDTTLEINAETTTVTVTEHIGDGTLSVSSSDTDVVTASISDNTITVTGVDSGEATITVTASATSTYQEATATIAVTVQAVDTRIFGVSWDGSSSPQMTRTDDAVGFVDPNPSVNGRTGSSPFDNIMPWAGMQIVEDANAGTVVSIPKFYYQYVTYSNLFSGLRISNVPQEGFSVSPAHMDRGDGAGERDVVYVGRYHCSGDSNSEYKSVSGVLPKVSITRNTARYAINNLGSNIWQFDFATLLTIWMLYIVEFANWDSQGKIGYGCGNGSSTGTMGYTDNMQYHTGTTLYSRTAYGLGTQYRYIEGLWDNVYDFVDGIRFYSSANPYVFTDPSTFSDTSGGIALGFTTPTTSGDIVNFRISTNTGVEWAPYVNNLANDTTYSTYLCDEFSYYSYTYRVLCVGGNVYQNKNNGLFCIRNNNSNNGTSAYIGCRLMILP